MGLFRRRREHPAARARAQGEAIADFWRWWLADAERIRAALAPGAEDAARDRLVEEMTARVEAIDPGLAWNASLDPQGGGELTVTAEGDPALRRVARRWMRAAPASPGVRVGDMNAPTGTDWVLDIGNARIAADDVRVAVRRRTSGLDVRVLHPLFATMPDEDRMQIAFLALDSVLGEEAAELWLDDVAAGTDESSAPPAGRSDLSAVGDEAEAEVIALADLPGRVSQLAREVMPDGEMGWNLLRADAPGAPVMITCRARLAPVQAPDLDQHVSLQVPYAQRTEDGLPGPESLRGLQELEDHLEERLEGSGMHVASVTTAGMRTLHFYLDSATPAIEQLRAAAAGWTEGPIRLTDRLDPAWDEVRDFRV